MTPFFIEEAGSICFYIYFMLTSLAGKKFFEGNGHEGKTEPMDKKGFSSGWPGCQFKPAFGAQRKESTFIS
jgi:hypothetical protein